jgi:large subunit ribosomal protein L35
MPKLKTHKGTAKRVRRSSGGKLLRENAATHHKLAAQTMRGKRAKDADSRVDGKIGRDVKRALGI